jgi:hypothetical protein
MNALTGTNVMTSLLFTPVEERMIHVKRAHADAPMMIGYETHTLPWRIRIAIAMGYIIVKSADDTSGFVLLKYVINTGIIMIMDHIRTPVKICPHDKPACIYSRHIK